MSLQRAARVRYRPSSPDAICSFPIRQPTAVIAARKSITCTDSVVSPAGNTVAERLEIARGHRWIAPPTVKHGFDIVTIIVGPNNASSSVGSQQKFSIHRNLLLAASAYFQAALTGNFKESKSKTIHLSEDTPQVFQVFYDWLYSGIASEQDEDGNHETDHFWLLVYQMADRLLIDGLKVIAYERFQACFKPVTSRILPEKRKVLPSRDLLTALFESEVIIDLFRAWVVDHMLYYYHSLSSQLGGAEVLVVDFPALTAEIGKALINDKVKLIKFRRHPSSDDSFAKKHGLDSSKIRAAAKSATKTPDNPDSKVVVAGTKRKRVQTSRLIDELQHTY